MKTNQLIALAIATAAGVASADSVYVQDFSVQGAGYTTSDTNSNTSVEYTDGSFDFFTQSDGSNHHSSIQYNGSADGYYFAGMDINSTNDGGPESLPLYLTTSTFSIDGYSNLQFMLDLAEDDSNDGNEDWDASDIISFEYQVDGGSWVNIFDVLYTDSDPGDTTNFAPQLNGTEITDTFQAFSADLSGVSGTTMALRVVWDIDSGDEDLAIDGLSIFGESMAVVPLPTAAIAGLGMLGLMGATRRFRK